MPLWAYLHALLKSEFDICTCRIYRFRAYGCQTHCIWIACRRKWQEIRGKGNESGISACGMSGRRNWRAKLACQRKSPAFSLSALSIRACDWSNAVELSCYLRLKTNPCSLSLYKQCIIGLVEYFAKRGIDASPVQDHIAKPKPAVA